MAVAAAATGTLRRSSGGAVAWSRSLLGGLADGRFFSSHPAAVPSAPFFPSSPISSSYLPFPQLVLPGMFFGTGSMELMAVPKKKVSPYKKGLRNGPKALKPVPVIVRCKACGRVKLPHFYCCSGDRGSSGRSESAS